MPLPKDKDWLNGYKSKTPIYAVYNRPTSKQGTQTESEGPEKKGWCYLKEDLNELQMYHANSTKSSKKFLNT